MYTSKIKIKTSSVNAWRSLCWWPDLSDCLVTSYISQGRPHKKPADHNCWDDGEARREDLGWQSKDVVWRRHWRQTDTVLMSCILRDNEVMNDYCNIEKMFPVDERMGIRHHYYWYHSNRYLCPLGAWPAAPLNAPLIIKQYMPCQSNG